MFGYVKPKSAELLVKEYEFYKATYCGICRAMKKHIGLSAPMTITYDSVFLALIRMLLVEDSDIGVYKSRCAAHPLKKKPMLRMNSALEYTARAFAVLTYYKALDDVSDERGAKKLAVGLCKPTLNAHRRRADVEYLDRVCREKLSAISELEKSGEASLDKPARLFGELLSEIFSGGLSGDDKLVFSEVGVHLGKFIYLADAVVDYEKDKRKKRYNPLPGEDARQWEEYLVLAMGRCTEYYEKLPLVQDKALLDNILYSGVWINFGSKKRQEDKDDRRSV